MENITNTFNFDENQINSYMKYFEKKYSSKYQIYKYHVSKLHPDATPYNINYRDQKYLEQMAKNSLVKRNKRLEHIKTRLKNDIAKGSYDKNYQFNSIDEYFEIEKYVKHELNSRYHFNLQKCTSDKNINLYKNKLKTIYGSVRADYPNDDEKIIFVNEKVPIIYGFFNKFDRSHLFPKNRSICLSLKFFNVLKEIKDKVKKIL